MASLGLAVMQLSCMVLLSIFSSFWGSHIVLYVEDWDVLLLISQEGVEFTIVKIAGAWRKAVGGCSSARAFLYRHHFLWDSQSAAVVEPCHHQVS